MKSIILSLILACVSAITTCAQELTGIVKDKNQKGVPYVNIGIPSKAFGIITDDNGNFKLKLLPKKKRTLYKLPQSDIIH